VSGMEQTTTEKSHEQAMNAIQSSDMLQGTTWPRWAEFTVTAQVHSEEDFEELFAYVSGEVDGPICPDGGSVPCSACDGATAEQSEVCSECDGDGVVRGCGREHFAHAQMVHDGLSAFEAMMKLRLEAVVALLESEQVEAATAMLREELAGFAPLLTLP
jgi:hypothetical protein